MRVNCSFDAGSLNRKRLAQLLRDVDSGEYGDDASVEISTYHNRSIDNALVRVYQAVVYWTEERP